MRVLDVQLYIVAGVTVIRVDDVVTAENLHSRGTVSNNCVGLPDRGFNLRDECFKITSSSLNKATEEGGVGLIILSEVSCNHAANEVEGMETRLGPSRLGRGPLQDFAAAKP
jgi:hypothetical protein